MSNGNSGIDRSHLNRAHSAGVGAAEPTLSSTPKAPPAAAHGASTEPDDPKAGRHNVGAANEGEGLDSPRSSGVNTAAKTHANQLGRAAKGAKAGAPAGGAPSAPADGPQPDVAVESGHLNVDLKNAPKLRNKPTLMERLANKQSNIGGAIGGALIVGAPIGILVGMMLGGPIGAAIGGVIGLAVGGAIGWKVGGTMRLTGQANRIMNEDAGNHAHHPMGSEPQQSQGQAATPPTSDDARVDVTREPDVQADKNEAEAKLQEKIDEGRTRDAAKASAGSAAAHGPNLAAPANPEAASVSPRAPRTPRS